MDSENAEKVLEKFDSIVKSFSKEDRIALVHDLDADGVSSGAIIYKSIELLRGKAPDLLITQNRKTVELLPETIEAIRKNKITKLVCVDFALDQQADAIAEAEKIVDQILVIDHHTDYKLPKSKKTFILKAQHIQDIDPSKYPSSKLVFDLFMRHVNIIGMSWVASVGLMGDNQLFTYRFFVQDACARSGSSFETLEKVEHLISSVEVLATPKLNALLKLIASAKSPQEILNSEYAPYAEQLESKVNSLFEEFNEKKEVFEKQELIWFEFNSNDNIKSALINKASNELFPNKTLIFVQRSGSGFVSFSARRQDFAVKTNELLEKAVKGFKNAGAGGHVPASAGRIMEKDLPEFKKRILKFLSK